MKKRLVIILMILLILTISCKKQEVEQTPKEQKTLGELQIEACNAADNAGTCNSRLIEVGIVTPEECCAILGKCC